MRVPGNRSKLKLLCVTRLQTCYSCFMTNFQVPDIIYEDNHILVAVKPPGMLSQADRTAAPDILSLLKRDLAIRFGKLGEAYLGLVHRLDRPTSGLMVFAKTSKAAARLSESFRTREVRKLYLAVTRGIPDINQGVMKDFLSKKESEGRVQVGDDVKDGYHAELSWEVIFRDQGRGEGLLVIDLITGRRHQIRAQMAAHDLPILGDRRYGLMDARDLEVPTVALHAYGLSFLHPVRKETMTFYVAPSINPSFAEEHLKSLTYTKIQMKIPPAHDFTGLNL